MGVCRHGMRSTYENR